MEKKRGVGGVRTCVTCLVAAFVAVVLMGFAPVRAYAAGNTATVAPDTPVKEIQDAFDGNDTIIFEAGDYSDVSINVTGSKVVVPEGAVKFTYTTPKNAFVLSDGSSLTIGDGTPGKSIEIDGASNGVYSNNASVAFVLAPSTELWVHNSVQIADPTTGNGISMNGKGTYSVTAKEGSTLKLTNNKAGIYTYGTEPYYYGDTAYGSITVRLAGCELVDLSGVKGKGNGSSFHQGDGEGVAADIVIDGCKKVRMNGNETDAVCFNYGTDDSYLKILNCPDVEMKDNGHQGTNGGYVTIEDSTVDISGNVNVKDPHLLNEVLIEYSNLFCSGLTAVNSKINADNAGENCGIWVDGTSSISNTTISARYAGSFRTNQGRRLGYYDPDPNNSELHANYPSVSCNGIFFGGETTISGSTIDASNCAGSGIVFANSQDASQGSTVTASTMLANNNGFGTLNEGLDDHDYIYKSGIAIIAGQVNVESSVVSATGNEHYGIGYYHDENSSGNFCKMNFDGKTVCRIDHANKSALAEAFARVANKDTYVLSGSLQGEREHMAGSENYTFNGVKTGNKMVYAAPVNETGTMLTRFDLHRKLNAEANLDSNEIEVSDPNGDPYTYEFRYNAEGEDLVKGESGNAYVWTPVTVVHYDATEGAVSKDNLGTAAEGDVSLTSTRGEGCALGNVPVMTEDSYIDATDYTICGNSIQLSEGVVPQAQREGYTFAGWFYAPAEHEAEAAEAAKAGDYKTLYALATERFDQATKTNFGNDLGQVTVYAKWEKTQKPVVPTNPEKPAPGKPAAGKPGNLAQTGDPVSIAALVFVSGVGAAALFAGIQALRRRG